MNSCQAFSSPILEDVALWDNGQDLESFVSLRWWWYRAKLTLESQSDCAIHEEQIETVRSRWEVYASRKIHFQTTNSSAVSHLLKLLDICPFRLHHFKSLLLDYKHKYNFFDMRSCLYWYNNRTYYWDHHKVYWISHIDKLFPWGDELPGLNLRSSTRLTFRLIRDLRNDPQSPTTRKPSIPATNSFNAPYVSSGASS